MTTGSDRCARTPSLCLTPGRVLHHAHNCRCLPRAGVVENDVACFSPAFSAGLFLHTGDLYAMDLLEIQFGATVHPDTFTPETAA